MYTVFQLFVSRSRLRSCTLEFGLEHCIQRSISKAAKIKREKESEGSREKSIAQVFHKP